MSYFIHSIQQQQCKQEQQWEQILDFKYLQTILLLSLNQLQQQANSQFTFSNIQIINLNSNTNSKSQQEMLLKHQNMPYLSRSLMIQVMFSIYSKRSEQNYQILIDISLNNLLNYIQYWHPYPQKFKVSQNHQHRNVESKDTCLLQSQKQKRLLQRPKKYSQFSLNLSVQLRLNNYCILNNHTAFQFSQRQIMQIYELVKNFNTIFSCSNSNTSKFFNIKLFITETGHICISSSRIFSSNQHESKINNKYNSIKNDLVQYWKQLSIIVIQFSELPHFLNFTKNKKQTFTCKNEHQSTMSEQKSMLLYKKTVKQLFQLRKTFSQAKSIKTNLQSISENNLQLIQKSLFLLIPQFISFKTSYNYEFCPKSCQRQKSNYLPKLQSSEQCYEKIIQKTTQRLDKKQALLKGSLKNKIVHGLILINQKQRKNQQNMQKEIFQKQSQKMSSQSSQRQSIIKRIKHQVLLVNTIFKLRKVIFRNESLRQKTSEKNNQKYPYFDSDLYQNQQQYQKYCSKIQICQYFAQKSALAQNKSSIQSFCNQYLFLKDNADQYCKYVAKYYLNVEQEEKGKKICQRKIYSKWQLGDLHELVYKKVSFGKSSCISNQTLLNLCSQMSLSLSFLNRIRIVHRDIKMSNFLISEGMTVKLTDFGSCHPEYYCSLKYMNNDLNNNQYQRYSQKMRTSYGLTYNNQLITPQIRKKYTKQQFNSHISFDMYCFGLIIKQLIYKTVKNQQTVDNQIIQNIIFLYQSCMEIDPSFRFMAFQAMLIMKNIQKLQKYRKKELKQEIKDIAFKS